MESSIRYYPSKKSKDRYNRSLWAVRIFVEDKKRRLGKEKQFSDRISNLLSSDKICDNDFMAKAWPKIVEQYTNEVEKNSTIFQQEYGELLAHDSWCSPPIWSYSI